jgi:hypothetical protein
MNSGRDLKVPGNKSKVKIQKSKDCFTQRRKDAKGVSLYVFASSLRLGVKQTPF